MGVLAEYKITGVSFSRLAGHSQLDVVEDTIWQTIVFLRSLAMRLSATLALSFVSAVLALPGTGTTKAPETFRRPDSAWEFIVKGADAEDDIEKRGESNSSIAAYNLRGQSVDPSSLGIDKVKQYSGYLDDDENDKHLFYCESKESRGSHKS